MNIAFAVVTIPQADLVNGCGEDEAAVYDALDGADDVWAEPARSRVLKADPDPDSDRRKVS